MPKINVNFLLIIIGFVMLLSGSLINEKSTVDFQNADRYIVISKSLIIRLLGIVIVLNGLVYALFEKINFSFNIRYKYFGIILFFLSLLIVASGILFFSPSNGLENGILLSLNQNAMMVMIILAGLITMFLSLFMPLFIWVIFMLKSNVS